MWQLKHYFRRKSLKSLIMEMYLKCLHQYADFQGRARRKEYWMFVLFNAIAGAIAATIDLIIGFSIVSTIYSLAVLVPCLAVTARRLHDMGKSGWMMLVALIPVIGAIWLLVLLVTDSQTGENQWGQNPKEA